jgi:hypothetical protein
MRRLFLCDDINDQWTKIRGVICLVGHIRHKILTWSGYEERHAQERRSFLVFVSLEIVVVSGFQKFAEIANLTALIAPFTQHIITIISRQSKF